MDFDDVERRVVDAYLAIRAESDDPAVSVTALCKRAHVSRSTFYQHFESASSLPQIISYAIIHDVRKIFRDFGYVDLRRFRDGSTPIPMFLRVFEYIDQNRNAFALLFLSTTRDEKFHEEYDEDVRESIRLVLGDSLDANSREVVASLCLGSFENLTVDWLRGSLNLVPYDMALISTRVCLAIVESWQR